MFRTGDRESTAVGDGAAKFLDPDETVDLAAGIAGALGIVGALKTLGAGAVKKALVHGLLDSVAGPSMARFRGALEREAKELTWIGNNLRIRHAETSQESLASSAHVDYLFHRLFALILLILRERGRALTAAMGLHLRGPDACPLLCPVPRRGFTPRF